ncbi:MAG: hypothetical protein GX491_05705 [Chloroflexi bacterium]|nr:hypothetical protein [Chloroflexota bacterium]
MEEDKVTTGMRRSVMIVLGILGVVMCLIGVAAFIWLAGMVFGVRIIP